MLRLYIIHMIGFIIIQKYICILMLMTIYECNFFEVYIFPLKSYVYSLILQQQQQQQPNKK